MKLVFTALVILGVLYGVYQFAIAANGWFQMSGAVEDVDQKELAGLIERTVQSGGLPPSTSGFDSDRYTKMREDIMKRAEEARLPLRRDDVAIGVVEGMLEVRLAWDAPIVVYNSKPYVEIPMTMQRRFSLQPRKGF